MSKKYPKMNLYADPDLPRILAWLAATTSLEEGRKVSPSEVVRRLARAEYDRRGGPPLPALDDADSHLYAA